MIYATISKWISQENLKQIQTKWYISLTKDFSSISKTVTTEGDNLYILIDNAELPLDTYVYIKAQRIFENSDIEYYTDVLETKNIDASYGPMMLAEDIVIDQPYVYINKEQLYGNNETFEFKTSKFRCKNDFHKYTHYFILDNTGSILYSNMYNKKEKLVIQVPNNPDYVNKNTLIFIAIHGGASGVESKIGKYILTSAKEFNYEITTNLTNVPALKDLEIKFQKVNRDADLGLIGIELLDYNTDEKIIDIPINTNKCIIPWFYLKEGTKYKINILGYDTTYNYSNNVKIIIVEEYSNLIIRNESHVYNNSLAYVELRDTIIPNNIHTESMFNGMILIPNTDKTIDVFKVDNNLNLIKTDNKANGIQLLSTSIKYMLIKTITKGMVLIDTYDNNNVPTFMVYNYNNNSNMFTLIYTKTREDEIIPLGKYNSILQTEPNTFYYIPIGTNKLRKYDIKENTITDLAEIPLEDLGKGLLLRSIHNQILIANSQNYETYFYSLDQGTFIKGPAFSPQSFVNRDNRMVSLINGDNLIFKLSLSEYGRYNKQNALVEKGLKYIRKPPEPIDTTPTSLEVSGVENNYAILNVNGNVVLDITTNAEDFSIESDNPDSISVDKDTKTITGVSTGEAVITIKARYKSSPEKTIYIGCSCRESGTEYATLDISNIPNTTRVGNTIDIGILTGENGAYTIESVQADTLITINNDNKTIRTIEPGYVKLKITGTEDSKENNVKVYGMFIEDINGNRETIINIEEKFTNVVIGTDKELHITTNASDFTISSSNTSNLVVTKTETGVVLSARGEGFSNVTVRATAGTLKEKIIAWKISTCTEDSEEVQLSILNSPSVILEDEIIALNITTNATEKLQIWSSNIEYVQVDVTNKRIIGMKKTNGETITIYVKAMTPGKKEKVIHFNVECRKVTIITDLDVEDSRIEMNITPNYDTMPLYSEQEIEFSITGTAENTWSDLISSNNDILIVDKVKKKIISKGLAGSATISYQAKFIVDDKTYVKTLSWEINVIDTVPIIETANLTEDIPSIQNYSYKLAQFERPDLNYAEYFPSTSILTTYGNVLLCKSNNNGTKYMIYS